jgi:hypothetical protein
MASINGVLIPAAGAAAATTVTVPRRCDRYVEGPGLATSANSAERGGRKTTGY